MAKEKKPRREFKPQSHAAVYGVAIIYLGYLLVRLIAAAITGGTDAPSPLHLVLGIVVLGGGIGLLGYMIWRMAHLSPPGDEKGPSPEPEDGAGAEIEEKES